MNKIYNHKDIEYKKIDFWYENKFFIKRNLNKKPFSIIMPPPNVTGKLHIGHAWDYSLQDLMIRYKKLSGYDVLFVPGMDHAGIATQSKVEKEIWEKSRKTRYDLGKNKLLEEIFKFSKQNTSIIKQQWRKLGLAINIEKEYFTFDENIQKTVNKIFVKLYKEKLIYQDKKIIPFDIKQQTALSNIEVEYKESKGKLYYFKYFSEDRSMFLEIATTRPETMFADQALIVNTKDKKYTKLLGKKFINPINNELIPLLADDYVSADYGTGVMKCTPAHDVNDYKIGKKNNLKFIQCIDKNGKLTAVAGDKYQGMDRFESRKLIVEELNAKKLISRVEEIIHNVSYSQRSNSIIEPLISDQWFISMQKFAKKIIKLQNSKNKINFFPDNFNNNLISWMKNLDDWCISRQIWWGHQLPVWKHKKTNQIYVNEHQPNDIENWNRDTDVLDTWFSSSLLPFAALGWGFDEKLFNRFFPSDVLVTGYDIIFFWVSRMIFQSWKLLGKNAFSKVLIHGLIRDKDGNKMSKSLGNGIDPMDIIYKYGADTLRFFLLTNSSPGKDLKYSDDKINYSWSFINKIWNASRFIIQQIDVNSALNFNNIFKTTNDKINKWILNEFSNFQKIWINNMEKFEFSIAGFELTNFFWDKYCSKYIEFIKITMQKNKTETLNVAVFILVQLLKMLHPYTPFITEEIYQKLNLEKSILLDEYKIYKPLKNVKNIEVDVIIDVINKIRDLRAKEKITNKMTEINMNLIIQTKINITDLEYINDILSKTINSKILNILSNTDSMQKNMLIPIKNFIIEILPNDLLNNIINKNLQNELNKINNEIIRSEKILSNKNFISRANPDKVQLEKTKLSKFIKAKKAILAKIRN